MCNFTLTQADTNLGAFYLFCLGHLHSHPSSGPPSHQFLCHFPFSNGLLYTGKQVYSMIQFRNSFLTSKFLLTTSHLLSFRHTSTHEMYYPLTCV